VHPLLLAVALCFPALTARADLDGERLARLDAVLADGIARGDCPGAVVLVVHQGRTVFRKAYGRRSLRPTAQDMTVDTIFDLASLTKPLATATSVLLLVDQGKLRLDDPVAKHLPAFAVRGKEAITVEQLLLHTSGLVADNPLADYQDSRDKALERVLALAPERPPGSRFVYSDVNYIVLGLLVERVSGMPLDQFAARHVFGPLGMHETTFLPGAKLRERAAPTEQRDGQWLLGEVHDPRAARLGGVAGHAGLFAPVDDLAVFCRVLLDGGRLDGKQVWPASVVQALTTPRPVPLANERKGLRTLGWDVDTPYSANRGSGFRAGTGLGHTGFTGTSIWLDPDSGTAVLFLSNRVHPDGKGNVTRLRGQVATVVANALPPR
jgi:CubicO group peptidase (beta-lactamase class C family)